MNKEQKDLQTEEMPDTHYSRNRAEHNTECGIGENTWIQTSELEEPLKSINNRNTLREECITVEMLKEEGETLKKANHAINLLHKCLEEGPVPEAWRNAEV